MSAETSPPLSMPEGVSPEDLNAALFLNMILQQANMALMLLGKVPDPRGGSLPKDLEAARLFIDQLEMLEAKTKGNLTPAEDRALKQSLAAVRMAFVEEVETEGRATTERPPTAGQPEAPAASEKPAAEEESRRKFTKKY